jgi:protein involved in polysaccharide export with SLBB domain
MSPRCYIGIRRAASVLALTFLAALGACSDGTSMGSGLEEHKIARSDLTSYRLGAGDKVRLNVFGEAELSGTFEISATGQISLPLVGDIPAAGLDVNGLRDAAAQRLSKGYLKQPKITVEVVGYRPIYVHGEVKSAGEFPFKNGLRLRDAIALAGGYTYRANHGFVVLARDGTQKEARVRLPTDILVMPGDNIRVPERYF